MSAGTVRYVYGPVPSRRLGRSLGVDLVPFKVCTYDCIYCQLGRTTNRTLVRAEYVPVEDVLAELDRNLERGDVPDYITLAGSGEPTLHSGIGRVIERIRERTKVPVAVLTNGSLLWMKEVQDDLMTADLVLPSLDAGDERLFRTVNRPHEGISFECMVDGMAEFTRRFPKEVWLEILLLAGMTGMPSEVKKIAALASLIGPARIQLNTAVRPPVEDFALSVPPDEMQVLKGFFPEPVDIICDHAESRRVVPLPPVREEDILALLRRRPCTAEDIAAGLGIHVAEVLKRLDGLTAAGTVCWIVSDGRNVYAKADS
ncbi:MAG: radical SAM protein [Syntrophales bacterium]